LDFANERFARIAERRNLQFIAGIESERDSTEIVFAESVELAL
jgi:hypothetical protein